LFHIVSSCFRPFAGNFRSGRCAKARLMTLRTQQSQATAPAKIFSSAKAGEFASDFTIA
jgi:hypothetical protein